MEQDPALALASYEALPEDLQTDIAWQLGAQYLQRDPEAALTWMLDQPIDGDFLALNLRMADPASTEVAEAMLNNLPAGEQRDKLLLATAAARGDFEPETTVEWLEQFRAEPGYEAAYARSLSAWAGRDPAAAAAQWERQPPADAVDVARNIIANWAYRDADAAINWAQGLADPVLQRTAIATTASALYHQDPERAWEIFLTLPPGEDRDRAGVKIAVEQGYGQAGRTRTIMEALGLSEELIDQYSALLQP